MVVTKKEALIKAFQQHFSGDPRVFQAPGRVNLIGEHTDYNDGFVFPIALELCTSVVATRREDQQLRIFSNKMAELIEIDLTRIKGRGNHWSDYPVGVAMVLQQEGLPISGAELYIDSKVPVGSGLSSSAALEVATAYALTRLSHLDLDKTRMAKLCQRAENEFVGMKCGIMDQFIACYGQQGHALLLDCRTLDFQLIPLPASQAKFIICNTMVKHELGASEYNKRRAECESAVQTFQKKLPGIKALRDVSVEQFTEWAELLPTIVRNRARHVITENKRVQDSVNALKENDLARFGELMNASHNSLRDDYEVSCQELDLMVNIARSLPGILGARMTGGGFGGCTVNLVQQQQVEMFCEEIKKRYHQATQLTPEVYVSAPSGGVREL